MPNHINEYVHKALTNAYPNLRFHIRKGRKKPSVNGMGETLSIVVEYDREGVVAYGGNEASMRLIVKDILDNPPVPTTVKSVTFRQYVDPRVVEFNQLHELTQNTMVNIKRLIEEGAPDEAIMDRLKRYRRHEL